MARKRIIKGTVEFSLKDSPYVVVKPVRGLKTKKGYVQVRMTGKGGVVRTSWVKENTFKTSPKYAHLREDVKRYYYRGYPSKEYRAVEKGEELVKYDIDYARGQVDRLLAKEKVEEGTKQKKKATAKGIKLKFAAGAKEDVFKVVMLIVLIGLVIAFISWLFSLF